MTTYLITGATRGIGLEFARQLSQRGKGTVVLATARDPSRATELAGLAQQVLPLEVSDESSIAKLPGLLKDRPIDVLINNAGVGSEANSLSKLVFAEFQRVFTINSFAPLMIAGALLPNLRAGRRKTIFNISSQLGSIANNQGGSSYAYRASKSALNQLTVSLSAELKSDGFCCVVAHPGWVKTDMGGPGAPLSPHDSVQWLLKLIDALTPQDSGKFFNYDGNPMPW